MDIGGVIHSYARIELMRALDTLARLMRSLGLRSAPKASKRLLKSAFAGQVLARIDGLSLIGPIETRGYLYGLMSHRKDAFFSELFSTSIKAGMVVLDIGAFLGWFTLLAARKVGSAGRVYSFEPDPRSFAVLLRNIDLNRFGDRVIALQKAVSDKTEKSHLFLHAQDPSRSSLVDPSAADTTSVDCVSLDEFLDRVVRVDVIKMDIEGGEVQALKGMLATIANASQNLTMFVECNPASLAACGQSALSLISYLKHLNFEVSVIDEQKRELSPDCSRLDSAKYSNLFCVRV